MRGRGVGGGLVCGGGVAGRWLVCGWAVAGLTVVAGLWLGCGGFGLVLWPDCGWAVTWPGAGLCVGVGWAVPAAEPAYDSLPGLPGASHCLYMRS